MNSRVANPSLFSLFICLVIGLTIAGCGQGNTGPSPQDLIRRQRQQEREKLSQPKTLEERLAKVEDYLANGNTEAARKEIRPLLVSDPQNRDVIFLSAKCEARSGDAIMAAEILESIDESDVEAHSEALWLAAGWLIDADQYDLAQAKLQRMLELPGDHTRVHRKLASMLNNQGRRIEAAIHLKALARSGEIREKELVAMNTYGEPFIDESMPKPDFQRKLIPAALVEAKGLRTEGELQKSRAFVERLSDAFPQSTPISAFQGRVYADLQDEVNLRQWLQMTPDGIEREPEYWYTLGIWLQRQDRHREAVRCFAEAVRRDQTDRYSYLALARSLSFLGEDEVSKKAIERSDVLAETAVIAKKVGVEPGTELELNRMADILQQLQRPWEAIAWRSIAFTMYGASEAERAALDQQRAKLAADEDVSPADEFLVCGLDLTDWPLPSAEAIGRPIEPHHTAEKNGPKDLVQIVLQDIAGQVGLDFQYDNSDDHSDDLRLIHQLTGGGIGVIDIDLDGYSDLYLTQGGGAAFDPQGSKPNQLYRNLGGQRFVNVSVPSQTDDRGYGQGVAAADINQDGFPDLVVANIGPNILYLNNGDGTFTAQTLSPPDSDGGWTTSIACGDLSGDRLPEIVEVNYIDDPTALTTFCSRGSSSCSPRFFQPAADRVWQVNSDGSISSWDGCREIADKPSYGFAALIANFDGKAGNDLYIANDTRSNHFWVSQSGESAETYTLLESSRIYGCGSGLSGQPRGSMGIALGDFDRNQKVDLHVTNYWNEPADMYMQQATGSFVPAKLSRGVYNESRQTVGWGTQAVDFDRNGWLDLAVVNGHVMDNRYRGEAFAMRPQLFQGDADGFHFITPTENLDDYWSNRTLGRTMAVIDWNADSKPDLVINHLDQPLALLENRGKTASSVQFELVGNKSERDAVGATVTVTCGNQVWKAWVSGGDGFLCSNEPVVDFGVGTADTIDHIEVQWPSGETQQFSGLPANERYLIVEGEEEVFVRSEPRG